MPHFAQGGCVRVPDKRTLPKKKFLQSRASSAGRCTSSDLFTDSTSHLGIYYAAQNPDINVEKLTHFALGIFWKSAVHAWRHGKDKVGIELGPYAEPIRLWLRGEGPFPKNVNLALAVARRENALVILTGPVKQSTKRWQSFSLQVPGLLFTLHVGKLIDPEMKDCCFHEEPTHPIFVSDDIMAALWKKVGDHYRDSRKTRGYLATKAKRSSKRNEWT